MNPRHFGGAGGGGGDADDVWLLMMSAAVHDGIECHNFYPNCGKHCDIQSHHTLWQTSYQRSPAARFRPDVASQRTFRLFLGGQSGNCFISDIIFNITRQDVWSTLKTSFLYNLVLDNEDHRQTSQHRIEWLRATQSHQIDLYVQIKRQMDVLEWCDVSFANSLLKSLPY